MLVDIIAGNRPDMMRMASVLEAIQNEQRKGVRIGYRLIYTGRERDLADDKQLYEQLDIALPNIYLDINETSEAARTAGVMLRYERLLANNKPDMVLVSGENTASMACAVTARKTEDINLAVINAGIRTGYESIQETNRIVADSLAHIYFTSSHFANEQLRNSGVVEENIFFYGNTRIDTLQKAVSRAQKPAFWDSLQLKHANFYLVSVNKPFNVGYPATYRHLLNTLVRASRNAPIIMLLEEQGEKSIQAIGFKASNLYTFKRSDYLQVCYLMQHARLIITDSSSMQEDAAVLQTPTATLYPYTDVPDSIALSTNVLATTDTLEQCVNIAEAGKWKKGQIPYLWDGQAGERVVAALRNLV